MADALPISAVLRSPDDVVAAVRARQNKLALSNEALEDLAGFCGGTVNKYLGPSREKTPGLGPLALMLAALGVGLVLVEDAEAAERMAGRWTKRKAATVRNASRLAQTAIKRALPAAVTKLASSGGKARWKGVDADERRRRMRELARRRWAA